jgi:hypothetical protein
MSRVRAVITSVVVTTSALALAACGSSSSGSKSGSTTTSSKSQSSSSQTTIAVTTGKSGTSGSASVSCDLVTPAQINSTLGISVGPPDVTNNDPVTVCTYKKSDGIGQVLERFETGLDQAGWETSKAGFTQHGEAIQDLPGLGDKAFTSTIGSGQFVTNTVVTQKGTTNLLITASGASLAQIETLARQVLASL